MTSSMICSLFKARLDSLAPELEGLGDVEGRHASLEAAPCREHVVRECALQLPEGDDSLRMFENVWECLSEF